MTTVGKVVLGMMGRLRPAPAIGDSASTIALPDVDPHGGMPLMEALAAAAHGLATVIRAWIDRTAIAEALGLTHDHEVLFSQTVGYPTRSAGPS